MNGGGGPHDPPLPPLESDGGEFLLRLLQQQQQQHYHQQQQHQQYQPHQQHQQHQQYLQQQLHRQEQLQQQQQRQQQQQSPFLPHNTVSLDPAVAAVGPTMPISTNHHYHHHHDPHRSQSQNLNLFLQGFPPNSPQTPSFFTAPHQHFDLFRQQQHQQQQQQHQQQQQQTQFRQEQQSGNHGMFGNLSFSSTSSSTYVEDEALRLQKLGFEFGGLGLGTRNVNGVDLNRRIDPRVNWGHGPPDQRRTGGPPPGFLSKPANQRRDFDGFNNVGREISSSSTELKRGNHVGFGFNGKSHEKDVSFTSVSNGSGVSRLLDHPGLPTGSSLDSGSASASASASDIEHSLLNSDNGLTLDEVDDLSEQLVDSVLAEVQPVEKNDSSTKKKHQRDKDFRSDARGRWILSQKIRNSRRLIECRRDIDWFDAPFLAIYESLIPAEEEKAKQNQLLMLLEKHVRSEWPNAKLYLYGSCANSFGVSKSDIDVCLATDDLNVNKSEILLKLAEILKSDNFQDVQALTRARVPIVKLMDPVTGISCDICINNLLAVVNTKLLRDYAEIDVRLRQLAFLVKHWAKSRGVNETYQGTLSSYAYVLMCIHFLQQRNPPILPCLQSMNTTYAVTVDDVKCTFFDQVERLRDFGSRNNESISKLLWGFFNYWAYCHDYANHVISVRTGCILRKDEKDWTRRIGNDRHLICIEDPFETSHDLGRVVDKRSIRVLREEFERAAEILQREPNPSVALFKPYIP